MTHATIKHVEEAMREVSARGVAVIKAPDAEAADMLEAFAAVPGAWTIGVRRSGPDEYTLWGRRRSAHDAEQRAIVDRMARMMRKGGAS